MIRSYEQMLFVQDYVSAKQALDHFSIMYKYMKF
jgi:hypothetical protein